jgi:hypothetical protein
MTRDQVEAAIYATVWLQSLKLFRDAHVDAMDAVNKWRGSCGEDFDRDNRPESEEV